ncbi:claudin-10-like isoform X2 [Heterodontus francisci]|uniref:claudin-10-like isoform X2 n=1 Tax=Heterodontus francisci TaxID=7792 RepID=UPI00355C8E65
MANARLQILGFIFGVVGLGSVFAATMSKEWKITSRATSVITATWVFQGLWTNCAGNALGSVHCRDHLTLFKLEGLSPLVACSWYAHQIILEHYDPIMPKYELGTALFSGWAGAALYILGGLSFCLSVAEDKHSHRTRYGAMPFLSSRTKGYSGAIEMRSSKSTGTAPKQFDKNSYV